MHINKYVYVCVCIYIYIYDIYIYTHNIQSQPPPQAEQGSRLSALPYRAAVGRRGSSGVVCDRFVAPARPRADSARLVETTRE